MSSKAVVVKDFSRRCTVLKYEKKKRVLKHVVSSTWLPTEIKFQSHLKLNKLPKNSSVIRIQNRCVLTGRAKGVYRKFKLTRTKIRTLMSNGTLIGVKKASW